MATQIPPPPKRQRLAKKDEPDPFPSDIQVVVQLSTAEDGSFGPPVTLPSGVDRAGLELLANSLRGTTSEPQPYSFSVALPAEDGSTISLPIDSSLAESLRRHQLLVSFESTLTIECRPEAVFRVREISRCSSSHKGHDQAILCAAFSPTGNALATGSGDNTARIWDLDTETPRHQLVGHTGWLLCVEWDPLGRTLATGSMDARVRLWDPKTGKALGDGMRGHAKWITSLAWEPAHLYVDALPARLIVAATPPRLASLRRPKTALCASGTRRTGRRPSRSAGTRPASTSCDGAARASSTRPARTGPSSAGARRMCVMSALPARVCIRSTS